MLFIVHYKTSPATRDTGIDRFKKTGGPPPDGVKMHGRWHNCDGSGGVCIAETDDGAALSAWMNQWTDVLTFDARPALNDEQFGKMLAG
jgi:hypothetical protein